MTGKSRQLARPGQFRCGFRIRCAKDVVGRVADNHRLGCGVFVILSEAKLQRRPEDFRGEARLSISDYPILAAH